MCLREVWACAGDDKLALYRSQYALMSKKLQQQETEVEKVRLENERLSRELQSKVPLPSSCLRLATCGAGFTIVPMPVCAHVRKGLAFVARESHR